MAFQPQVPEEQDVKIQLEGEEKKSDNKPILSQPSQPRVQEPSGGITDFLKTANHPSVCIMHLLFKLVGILLYDYVHIFVVAICSSTCLSTTW